MTGHAQIDALLREYDITHEVITNLEYSAASGARRAVKLPGRVMDDRAYLVALHEVGHILCGHMGSASTGRHANQLVREGEAWLWALAHLEQDVSREAARWALNECLESYSWRIVELGEHAPREYEQARRELRALMAAATPRVTRKRRAQRHEQLALAV